MYEFLRRAHIIKRTCNVKRSELNLRTRVSQDRVHARSDLHLRSSGNLSRITIAMRVYVSEDTTARLYASRRGANIIIDNPGKNHSSGNTASYPASCIV